jgi:hypothetical protein
MITGSMTARIDSWPCGLQLAELHLTGQQHEHPRARRAFGKEGLARGETPHAAGRHDGPDIDLGQPFEVFDALKLRDQVGGIGLIHHPPVGSAGPHIISR